MGGSKRVWCRAAARVSDAAETAYCFGQLKPQCTDDLSMGLRIRSNDKQEMSSVYQFFDVLYNLCN